MGWDAANARTPSAQAPTERCASAVRRTAVMYHAHHGTKLVLVWPPTIGNLETLGGSWMDGDAHKPLDAMRPFSGGGVHILNPGERLIIAPLAVHLVVNLTPAPTSTARPLSHSSSTSTACQNHPPSGEMPPGTRSCSARW